jgi:hypothetical protein
MKFASAVTAIVVVLFAHTVTAVPCSECPRGLGHDVNEVIEVVNGLEVVAEDIKTVIAFKPGQSR